MLMIKNCVCCYNEYAIEGYRFCLDCLEENLDNE